MMFELFILWENNVLLVGFYFLNIVIFNVFSEVFNCNKIKIGSLCVFVIDYEMDEGCFQKCVVKVKYIIFFEVFFGEDVRKRKMNIGDLNIYGIKKVKKKKGKQKMFMFFK